MALSVAHKRTGDMHGNFGDAVAATLPYQAALSIDLAEQELHPENREVVYQTCISLRNMGDLTLDDGQPDSAPKYYRAALALAEWLSTADPEENRYTRELVRIATRLAGIAFTSGDIPVAKVRYVAALELAMQVHDDERTKADQLAVATLHLRLGALALMSGDQITARKYLTDSLRIHEFLVQSDRLNTGFKVGMAGSHEYLGDVAEQLGDYAEAEQRYRTGVTIILRLAETNQYNVEVQQGLADVAAKLGTLLVDRGDLGEAANYLGLVVVAKTALFKRRPSGIVETQELSTALERLAAVLAEAGNSRDALGMIDAALKWRDRLRILEDRDGIVYATGLPPDRATIVEDVAATHLARIAITGEAEPDRSKAMSLLADLERRGLLTDRGTQLRASLSVQSGGD